MSSVIDFLERMGSDAQWRHASQEELEVAMAETDITTAERSAILAKDASELHALLRQAPLFAVFIPPDEEEEGEEDEEEQEGDEKHQPEGLRCSLLAPSLQLA
jgi:hypothetical protein